MCLGSPRSAGSAASDEAKQRQQHAAIAYGDANAKVNDLPASMVYPKGNR